MTIHWFDSETKRNMSLGHQATTTAQPNSRMFFQNVCQLVSTTASPKHPQSLMGLASASHSVRGVITAIISNISLDVSRR